jgi:ABC-type branched-subunit amino acid transport system permease subunit
LFSTQVVIWTAIGGRHSLLGAFVGAIVVASLSNYLNAVTPQYWQLLQGLVFIAVVIAFRRGLAGLAETVFGSRGRKRHVDAA